MSAGAVLALLAAVCLQTVQRPGKEFVVKSEVPRYVITLPATFNRNDSPQRFFHTCGRDTWEQVSAVLAHGSGPLKQNPAGVTLEDLLPFVKLPADSKQTFTTAKWNNLDIGVIEYQGIEENLPVIGLATVLPLQERALSIAVFAPTPLEKEARADFSEILSRITQTRVDWYTTDDLAKMKTFDLVGKAGAAALLLYPFGWVLFFRGDRMRAHWVRVGWLVVAAILLFLPISSPGPITAFNNLVVNALLPVLIVSMAVRRVKMGIDEG